MKAASTRTTPPIGSSSRRTLGRRRGARFSVLLSPGTLVTDVSASKSTFGGSVAMTWRTGAAMSASTRVGAGAVWTVMIGVLLSSADQRARGQRLNLRLHDFAIGQSARIACCDELSV